jgi:hypothetical protein
MLDRDPSWVTASFDCPICHATLRRRAGSYPFDAVLAVLGALAICYLLGLRGGVFLMAFVGVFFPLLFAVAFFLGFFMPAKLVPWNRNRDPLDLFPKDR